MGDEDTGIPSATVTSMTTSKLRSWVSRDDRHRSSFGVPGSRVTASP
ncbi:hypothetical protein ACTXO6_12845 [Corynebacterium variabile]